MTNRNLIKQQFTEAEATWLADVLEQFLATGTQEPFTQPPPPAAPSSLNLPPLIDRVKLTLSKESIKAIKAELDDSNGSKE